MERKKYKKSDYYDDLKIEKKWPSSAGLRTGKQKEYDHLAIEKKWPSSAGLRTGKQKEYDHLAIEKKWQRNWSLKKIYKTKDKSSKQKFYVLDMFPYPSGEGLHVGHPKGYIATDVVSRMKRMQGFNVLHPMGFDAFGLPAEQYAIKMKINPAIAVAKNVAHYKKQLKILGFDYDWSREVQTTDPKFYKWTQWIFLQLFKKGLAYEDYAPINWCPVDKTGLANEDVENGRCERCGAIVEKRMMRQWVLKITDYAERLLEDLDARISKDKTAAVYGPFDMPTFVQITEPGIAQADKPLVERNAICAIVKHWSEDKYIGLRWKKVAWKTLITGGPENGETPENGARAEIIQETGYKNPKFIKNIGKFNSKFFHVPKGVNRCAHFDILYFKLENGEKEKMSDEEQSIHEAVWITKSEMENFLSVASHKYVWQKFLNEKISDVPGSTQLLDWPESIKESQRNWIGKSEGAELDFKVNNTISIKVFTARPDTLFGATYLVLAPEHPLVSEFLKNISNKDEVQKYIQSTKTKTEIDKTDVTKDKTGVELKGIQAINPANQEKVSVWIADYVLPDYGTGAIMAVPTHDERDFEFAKKYNLPIKEIILINEDKKKITERYGGKWTTKYKLKDWVFSRQRYWGEPIPVLHGEDGKIIPVSLKDLPIKLPKVKYYEPTGTGESPLADISLWMNVKIGKSKYRRESNTMPQWAGSSWYYLRYKDPKNQKKLVDPKNENYWSDVDLYVGGAEHATRHLIYARFWHKFLYDIGVASTLEPFYKFKPVGLITGEDGKKMSKRFGNVINPDDIAKKFGADTLRVYEMFMGPFDQSIAWSTNSIVGARRFIERVWRFKVKSQKSKAKNVDQNLKLEILINKTIKKVGDDIINLKFNTAISSLMIFLNEFEKEENISKTQYRSFLLLLAPFAPHVTEELWSKLGNKKSIHLANWPSYDQKMIEDETVTLAVQVNGKTRSLLIARKDESERDVEEKAKKLPELQKWLQNMIINKVIYVKGRIINIVVDES